MKTLSASSSTSVSDSDAEDIIVDLSNEVTYTHYLKAVISILINRCSEVSLKRWQEAERKTRKKRYGQHILVCNSFHPE